MCFIPKRFIWFVLIFFPAPNFSAFSILIYRNWKFIITSISVIFRLNSIYTWIGKNQNRISLMSHRSSQESSQYMQWLHLDKLFFFWNHKTRANLTHTDKFVFKDFFIKFIILYQYTWYHSIGAIASYTFEYISK